MKLCILTYLMRDVSVHKDRAYTLMTLDDGGQGTVCILDIYRP